MEHSGTFFFLILVKKMLIIWTFPLDVLDEILDLIESVSEGFLTYFCVNCLFSLWLLADNLLGKWPIVTMYKMCSVVRLVLLSNRKQMGYDVCS